jgi:hypothetical protein
MKPEHSNVAVSQPSLVSTIHWLDQLVARLEDVFANKSIKLRTERDDICLRYLSLIFEHHRGILLLAANCRAPAFSLMRPLTESFLRLHVVMHGTTRQLESVKNDTYKTEFVTEGDLIDRVTEFQPLFGPLFRNIKGALHGLTHGGKLHLIRMANGTDLGPNYSNDDTLDLIKYVTLLTIVAAISVSKFLEWPQAVETSERLFDEYTAGVPGIGRLAERVIPR